MKPKRDPILGTQMCFFCPQGARRSNSSAGLSTRAGSRLHSLLHVFTATCQPPTCLAPRHLFRAEPLGCLRGATPLPLAGLLSLHQRRRARLCCRPCWTGWAPQQQGAALAPARVAPTRQWQPRVSATTTRQLGLCRPRPHLPRCWRQRLSSPRPTANQRPTNLGPHPIVPCWPENGARMRGAT